MRGRAILPRRQRWCGDVEEMSGARSNKKQGEGNKGKERRKARELKREGKRDASKGGEGGRGREREERQIWGEGGSNTWGSKTLVTFVSTGT